MKNDGTTRRIAIVGIGPRGLGALEALARRLPKTDAAVSVELFDPTPWPGAGPNYSPDQSPLCLLNIPVRAISVDPAPWPVASQGTFADWLPAPVDQDRFPARAELGSWLMERYSDLITNAPDALTVTHRKLEARRIEQTGTDWWLHTDDGRFGPFDEVLLTLGQPETAPDDQLARWQAHAGKCGADLLPAYPDDKLLEAAGNWAGKSVAIRGLGLSTLDVLRLLTSGMGGRFADGHYHRSGREPARILPFSLDGHPPAAKPATAELDAMFDPLPQETATFEAALTDMPDEASGPALQGLCDALIAPSLRILAATGGTADRAAVDKWLETERDTPGGQEDRSAIAILHETIAMAHGSTPPSPGYVIGQIWRKWQNELRNGFNPERIALETAKAVIKFDEGLKRFSYGPPVSAAEDLLTLIEDGLVDLRAVEDPDILLIDTGWHLFEDDASAKVTAIVDAVLPPPDLGRITDPLITHLLTDGRIRPYADGFGAGILPDGQVTDRDGKVQTGLSLLGRLALGNVIAVDSVHDCFGAASTRWAEGVTARAE